MKNFIQPEQFPYKSPPAGSTTAATTPARSSKAMDIIGYADLRKEQAEKRAARRADGHRHQLSFTEIVGAGPSQARSTSWASRCSTRPRSGSIPPARCSPASATKSQGQGHETTYAQIIAEELGIPGRRHHRSRRATPTPRPTAWAPTPAARRPTAGAAAAMAARKIRDKARKIAAHLLEVQPGRPRVGGRQVLGQGRRPRSRRRSRRSPSRPTPTIRRAWRPASRRSTTTTRPT